ncbi:MAG: DUF448 domain-containing protein [Candidatus Puniceispirillaceae bacterium]
MTERRCIASGKTKSASSLIRFVCGPDGSLVPDLALKLPGRGCWLSADISSLKTACNKGLFTRHIGCDSVSFDLVKERLCTLLGKRFFQSLSLARRAGLAIGGAGKLANYEAMEGLIMASDASPREAKSHIRRLSPQWVYDKCDSAELGAVFGRESIAYIGILPDQHGTQGGLSARLKQDIDRFAAFLPPLACQEGADGCITQS